MSQKKYFLYTIPLQSNILTFLTFLINSSEKLTYFVIGKRSMANNFIYGCRQSITEIPNIDIVDHNISSIYIAKGRNENKRKLNLAFREAARKIFRYWP